MYLLTPTSLLVTTLASCVHAILTRFPIDPYFYIPEKDFVSDYLDDTLEVPSQPDDVYACEFVEIEVGGKKIIAELFEARSEKGGEFDLDGLFYFEFASLGTYP